MRPSEAHQEEGGPPTRMEPVTTDVSGPFWEATRERRLVLQWCDACGEPVFYPREICPGCLRTEGLTWRPALGQGEVYAVSVQYRSALALPAYQQGPYAVALVELAEGVRMMTNVVNCDPEGVRVGMAVRVTWEPLSDGRNLPLFEPVPEG
jgi:uncharacterized protein